MTGTQITVVSFGYLHGPAPETTHVIDVRTILHDPHVDPAMRQMTGLDPAVYEHVLNTAGAREILTALHALSTALLTTAALAGRAVPVSVAVGCAGGRHRSVVVAAELAARLTEDGWVVDLEHRHVARPVVARPV